MDLKIDITDTVVLDDLSSTPAGIVLRIAIATVGVALGNALTWAVPKAFDAIKELVTGDTANATNN